MTRTGPQRRVIGVYLTTTTLYILASSVIWGINTLFLLRVAGLSIFQMLLVNTTFTVGQIIFEVPTGVVADTIGRKVALLLGIGTILVSTLVYVGAAQFHWGLGTFMAASVFLGLGFTFQVGTVDAWLVDALAHVGWEGPLEQVFAWGGMVTFPAMLGGTIIGGLLATFLNLSVPYLVRSALLAVAFIAVAVFMKDLGFERRALSVSRFGEETRRIFVTGLRYGWRHRVVRPLLWTSLLTGLFGIFSFYVGQAYWLELLGSRNLYWAVTLVVASGTAAGFVGNTAVRWIMKGSNGRRRAGRVLALFTVLQGLLGLGIAGVGLFTPVADRGVPTLVLAASMWVLNGFLFGAGGPIRAGFINEHIPSAQRATVLSVDALFADVGGSAGQPSLGYVAQQYSIPVAWGIGTLFTLAAAPFYLRADRRAGAAKADPAGPPDAADTAPAPSRAEQ